MSALVVLFKRFISRERAPETASAPAPAVRRGAYATLVLESDRPCDEWWTLSSPSVARGSRIAVRFCATAKHRRPTKV